MAGVGGALAIARIDFFDAHGHLFNGLLRTSRPKSSALRDSGSWADRRKVAAFNLFYADIEADALARAEVQIGRPLSPVANVEQGG